MSRNKPSNKDDSLNFGQESTSVGDQNTTINAQSIGQIIINNIGQKRVWIPLVILSITVLVLVLRKNEVLFPNQETSVLPIDSLSGGDSLTQRDTGTTVPLVTTPPPGPRLDSLPVTITGQQGAVVTLQGLTQGQSIYFRFTGQVELGMLAGVVGPDGRPGFAQYSINDNAPHGAVLGYIQETEGWYYLGSQAEIKAPTSGDLTLELFVNDVDRGNNYGQFTGVVVY